jgi:hypothetical protein
LKIYQNAGLHKDFKLTKTKESLDSFASGGLDDADILSARPSFPQATKGHQVRGHSEPEVTNLKDLKRDHSRTNDASFHLSFSL